MCDHRSKKLDDEQKLRDVNYRRPLVRNFFRVVSNTKSLLL